MNAILALLTAASVLAHAALGCCIHHDHDPSAARLASEAARQPEKDHHSRCATCCRRSQSNGTDPSPAAPGGNCGEQDCVAVAGGPPTVLLKAADTAFRAAALEDLAAISASSADYVQFAAVQHDLGPPVRPHLLLRVLLI
jgi:hypothetical protein